MRTRLSLLSVEPRIELEQAPSVDPGRNSERSSYERVLGSGAVRKTGGEGSLWGWVSATAALIGRKQAGAAAVLIGALLAPGLGQAATATTSPLILEPVATRNLVSMVRLKDGHIDGNTGIRPYTRAYGQAISGPLRFRHGSPPPKTFIWSSASERAQTEQSPGSALDKIASAYGLHTGFAALANSKALFDPARPPWWGLCAPWSWTGLHPKINALVDVDGPEGARGLWLKGEWLSRADLGNWMMALTQPYLDYASMALSSESVGAPKAIDIVKAAGLMMEGGPGLVADVHNDALQNRAETWNQPFYAADVTVKSLKGPAAEAIKALAAEDGWQPAAIKQVTVVGRYGVEVADDYEGPARSATKVWNMYVTVDEEGTAGWGYMANDPRLSSIAGLPERNSDDPPDYFVKLPLDILNAALAGKSDEPVFEREANSQELLFFASTVLQQGVPGSVRSAFESAVQKLPPGPIKPATVAALAARFPKVANAYASAEWQAHFASRGFPPTLTTTQ